MENSTFKNLLLGLLAFLFILTQPQFVLGQSYSVSINQSNGKSVVKIKDGKNNFRAEYSGVISLSEDETDIISISDNGYIEITKSSFGKKRRVRVETDNRGNLIRKYYLGRKELEYVPDGEKWLKEVLPEICKNTSIGAFSRVDNLYCKGGAAAVLKDIELKESDYVKMEYLNLLLNRDITYEELDQTIVLAGKTIESDHYLTELLQENQRRIIASPNGIPAYIEAVRSIESDHYKTEVLMEITDDPAVSDQSMLKILSLLDDMESDHYLSEILMDIFDERNCTPEIVRGIVVLSRNIESDHYKAEVFGEAVSQRNMDAESLSLILENLREIDSDHYYAEVIDELSDQRKMTDASLTTVVGHVFSDVESDHYKTEIFSNLLSAFDFESAALAALGNGLSRQMDSDNYISEIVNDIVDTQRLDEEDLVELIYALEGMKSDSYLSETLLELARHVNKIGGKSLAAYKEVAATIESDHYYREAMDIESFELETARAPRAPKAPRAPRAPKSPKSPKHQQQ